MVRRRSWIGVVIAGCCVATACGGGDADGSGEIAAPTTSAAVASASNVTLVTPEAAAATIDDPPADLVILDVRTPEEFAEGHIDGAIMIDFYRDDFAEQIAGLDPDVPYVLYCRSGNRSGQTRTIMADLGFAEVADVSGGILAWEAAGLPVVDG